MIIKKSLRLRINECLDEGWQAYKRYVHIKCGGYHYLAIGKLISVRIWGVKLNLFYREVARIDERWIVTSDFSIANHLAEKISSVHGLNGIKLV